MAILDAAANEIVIRVVYDGAPESGKTTSVRALAGSFARDAVTPEEDAGGRTLWFDWMEYVGGRFEGYQIRCQIVSVPGQRELDLRRRRLLASADVIVSVIDTTRGALATSLAFVRELRELVTGTSVGVVLQANKRDRGDAVPLSEVRRSLGGQSIGLVESIAADGTGIRETFVYAVRLALDRVRDLMSRGALAGGSPDERSASDLLAVLRGVEAMHAAREAPVEAAAPASESAPEPAPIIGSDASSVAALALAGVLEAEAEAAIPRASEPAVDGAPRPPDSSAPSGAIWPPVEGRAILAQASAECRQPPHRFTNGDWVVGLGSGWRVVSRRDAWFRTLDEGRAGLIQWARLHAASAHAISPRRCIVLSDVGDGTWRLWQVVRVEESLRDAIGRMLAGSSPELAVTRLCQGSKQLLDAIARVQTSPCDLACTFDTIGLHGEHAVYIGLMPSAVDDTPRVVIPPAALLRAQLAPVVAAARLDRLDALHTVITSLLGPEAA